MRKVTVLATSLALLIAFMIGESFAIIGPAHDNRASARDISVPGSDSTSTFLATTENNEPQPCAGIGSTVWYRFQLADDALVRISTLGSNYDTAIAIYDSAAPTHALACDDDSDEGLTSRIQIQLQAGKIYDVQAGGFASNSGDLVISLETIEPPARPSNDEHSAAQPISAPYNSEFDLGGATHEQDEPSHCNASQSIWYSVTPTANQELVLEAYGYDFPVVLVVYESSDFPNYSFCSDGYDWYPRLRFSAKQGRTYLIQVAIASGRSTYHAQGYMSVHEPGAPPGPVEPPPTPPTSTQISSLPFTDEGATTPTEESVRPCAGIGATRWYSYTADADRTLRVDTAGSSFDTAVAVYESASWPKALGCNDNLDTTAAVLEFTAQQGKTYYLQVGGSDGSVGDLRLSVTQAHEGFPTTDWPSIDEASIRPGVRLYIEGQGWCTSNFVFRGTGLRRGRLYIGTAGHCTELGLGAAVHMPSNDDQVYATKEYGPVIGHVAYSSWAEEQVWIGECLVVLCGGEGYGDRDNDFALIEIRSERRNDVHPAVLHYGGPTGIVDIDDIAVGQTVVSFGNSVLRPGPEELDHREGWVQSIWRPYTVYVRSLNPGVWGDSGSDAMLGDGRALGVVVTINLSEGTNGVAVLSEVLAFAEGRGWQVDLQTWELLQQTVLPQLPIVP